MSNAPAEEMIAVTLLQEPPCVLPPDDRWDENATLIAEVRSAFPELLRLARLGLTIERQS
jgi:hypothetical protein